MMILRIINEKPITTQQELVGALRDEGLDVTQATISRDIKELGLVKVPIEDGRYRYRESNSIHQNQINEQLIHTLKNSILAMDYAEPILVIDTLPASAQVVAEALDALNWSEVVGTLAGERTVFVAVKPADKIFEVMERIKRFRQH